MTHDQINAARQPIVSIRDGAVFADSRDVAAFFGKRHTEVLRSIRDLSCSEEFRRRNFASFKNNDLTGESTSRVEMTKDGFSFLVMGFTGGRAAQFKEAYIAQFNAMEAELRRPPELPDLSDPQVLLGLLTEHTAKRIEAEQRAIVAEQRVEAAKPKTQFYDQFVNADGLYTLQNGGRILNMGANKFIGRLKAGYLFYQGGSLIPRAIYRDQGLFEVKVTIIDDKSRAQTFLTPKGIQYFAKKFDRDAQLDMPLAG